MLGLLFTPGLGIAERLQNRETLLLQLLNAFRHELQRIGDEPWVTAVIAELARDIPQFAGVWQASSQLITSSAARPRVPFQIKLPEEGTAQFWVAAEPMTRDMRFRVVYLLPIDAATMAWCTRRAGSDQTAR
jgi:hypothetical protein